MTDDTPPRPLLSLAALTILDAGPAGQIRAAAAAGWPAVGLRLNPLLPSDARVAGDAPAEAEVERLLAETGLSVLEIGVFPITPSLDLDALEPVLDLSARIGARFLVCPVEDDEHARREATFAALCDRAATRGLAALVEFNPYSACRSLAEAHALVKTVARPNAGLVIDALHLSRSGGHPRDLAALDPALPRLVHFCDAAPFAPGARTFDDLRRESRTARLLPGDGALPLDALLDALPPGTPVSVEAPCARDAGLPAAERAHKALAATERFFARPTSRPRAFNHPGSEGERS